MSLHDAKAGQTQLKAHLNGMPPTLPGPRSRVRGGGGGHQLAQAELRVGERETLYTDSYPGVIEERKLVEQLRHTPGAAGGGGGPEPWRGRAQPAI